MGGSPIAIDIYPGGGAYIGIRTQACNYAGKRTILPCRRVFGGLLSCGFIPEELADRGSLEAEREPQVKAPAGITLAGVGAAGEVNRTAKERRIQVAHWNPEIDLIEKVLSLHAQG